jgi:hypothetical protein
MTGRYPPTNVSGNMIAPWNGSTVPAEERRKDPETCHCGAPALYRHPTNHSIGYCKAHKDDAKAATTKTRARSER